MQLDEWRARRTAAEKAIGVVESALMRVSARETLSIEELCELIRSIEMSNVQQVTRTLINEALTPEEEREWNTYYAMLPPEEVAANREHFEMSRINTQELLRLMNEGADPASAEVQALIERSNGLSTRARFREGYLVRLRWNEPVARKLLKLGQRLVVTTSAPSGSDRVTMGQRFQRFLAAAHRASSAGQAMEGVFREVKALVARGEKADSAEGKVLAKRFAEICSLNHLGDPQVYALWHVEFGEILDDPELANAHGRLRDSWQFLADATVALAS